MGLILWLFSGAEVRAATAGALPWSMEHTLNNGWVISSLKRHPEFLRVGLEREGKRAQIEIIASKGPDDAWSTRFYRVQPAPGVDAPKEALLSVLETLKELESSARVALRRG